MTAIKKLFKSLLIIFIVLILSSPLWINKIPLDNLSFLVGKTSMIDKYICEYAIKVAGDSMSPLVPQGSSIKLNRCFTEEDLSEGIVVLFGKDSEYHLGIIRHILPLDPVIYKISNERPNQRLQDMIREEIVAINQDIDTSNSIYQPIEDPDSFILDSDEYLSDLYLGKIPKGYGVEMAEVEKSIIFSKDEDKFCMVIVPKKELALVNIEIINTQTKQMIISSKNIVFNVRSEPNINCQDFGTEQGMLDLDKGSYRYRFFLNHQVLANIPFTVE